MKGPWRNPKVELPKHGEQVWMLYKHWKENGILGFQMMAGEVETSNDNNVLNMRANSCDYTGSGSWCVYFFKDPDDYYRDDICVAWAYQQDLPLPEWNEVNQ